MKKAMLWKLFERFGASAVQFVISLILARLLEPEHYGMLSIMIIFVSLANVLVQTGFNTSLIQGKEVTEEDYSSVLWVSLLATAVLYLAIFTGAPLIADIYHMPELIVPLRVIALVLFPGTVNSIQLAKASREMNFKVIFIGTMVSTIISGAVGVAVAIMGGGVWALVIQQIFGMLITCAVMAFLVDWKPRLVCNMVRVKVLIAYGWKLLAAGLMETLYQNLSSLVVGKKYDSGTLGYYNRGLNFPQFIINAINGAVQSVLLPAMAAEQDDKAKVKQIMRGSVMLSSYLIFPAMAGLAAVAEPMVRLLLTDKWLPCVPYLQVFCISFAFYPVHTSNLQAINAVGRSDIYLKLEVAKKTVGILALICAVFCFETPVAIALSSVFTSIVSSFINAFPNKKLIAYSYFEQMKDLVPALVMSVIMFVAVNPLCKLALGPLAIIIIQVVAGVAVYLLLSIALRIEPFILVKNMLLETLRKRKSENS